MAKKTSKIASNKGIRGTEAEYSPATYLDFDDIEEIKGLAVGDEITVVLKGTVKSLESRRDYEDLKKVRSSLCLEKFEAEIVSGASELEKFFADADD